MTVDKPHNIFFDAFAFMLNVASSVLIIFVNKQLMRPAEAGGAGFNFCTCWLLYGGCVYDGCGVVHTMVCAWGCIR